MTEPTGDRPDDTTAAADATAPDATGTDSTAPDGTGTDPSAQPDTAQQDTTQPEVPVAAVEVAEQAVAGTTADLSDDPAAAAPPAPETTPSEPSGTEPAGAPTGTGEAAAPTRGSRPAGPGGPGRQGGPGRPAGAARSGPGRPGGPGRGPGRGGSGAPGGRPRPAPVAPGAPTVAEPLVTPTDPHQWGRIDADGAVFVRTSEGERQVGVWQAGEPEEGLAHYARRFDDFSLEIAVLEARLASGSGDPKATRAQALQLREQVDTLAAVGDLDSAAARLEVVIGAAEQAVAGASQARAEARARAVAAKEALCAEAEGLSESTQWKTAGDRFKSIVDEWRQITGIDRKTDDALWKRFARARDAFTRHRGAHFAELDKQRGAARAQKEALIQRAEALSDSTEWGETAAAYRGLMDEWKAAGRAPRDVEEALWARFRAAQEAFFSRRNQTFSERDAEFEANAAVKEQLLREAAQIDPAADLDAAKAQLRSIQERWEAAGKVPRERIRELDQKLRAVEDRVRAAEDAHWRRTDPETQARVAQFRARVEQFRAQAAKARAAGDERRAREADAQAEQWEQWLHTAENAVEG